MLTNKEWLLINDTILIIHSTEKVRTMFNYFFNAIKPLVLYEKAMFYLLSEEGQTINLIDPVFVNVEQDFFIKYENLFNSSRFGRVAVNLRRTIAFRDSDLIPESIRTNTDIYKSFLLPYNLPYGGGIIITNSGILMAEVAFFRSKEQRDFTDKEIFILDLLKGHLQIRLAREKYPICNNIEIEDKTSKLINLGLTNREIEICKLIINNLTTSEISTKLNISLNTTKKHLSNIYNKLRINTRTQLMQIYFEL